MRIARKKEEGKKRENVPVWVAHVRPSPYLGFRSDFTAPRSGPLSRKKETVLFLVPESAAGTPCISDERFQREGERNRTLRGGFLRRPSCSRNRSGEDRRL